MDEIPTSAEGGEPEQLARRLREEGNLLSGEVFVVPHSLDGVTARGAELQKLARELDWRFYELSLVLTDQL
jgi:hypothetical protein